MSKYDGPSFYKKDPENIKAEKEEKTKDKSKYELPGKIYTRDDIQKEAFDYMETPSIYDGEREKKLVDERAQSPERYTFRGTKIPESLQKLDGWRQTKKNQALISEVAKRLQKEKEDYLLFADARVEAAQPKEKKPKPKSQKQKKAELLKEKMTGGMNKPSTGLHRSLSNIMAEDRDALKNGKKELK